MPKTIILNDVQLNAPWRVNTTALCVEAPFVILEDDGDEYESGTAYFWKVIPSPKNPSEPWDGEEPLPEHWYQLPDNPIDFGTETYFQVLAQLTADILAGLMHLVSE